MSPAGQGYVLCLTHGPCTHYEAADVSIDSKVLVYPDTAVVCISYCPMGAWNSRTKTQPSLLSGITRGSA